MRHRMGKEESTPIEGGEGGTATAGGTCGAAGGKTADVGGALPGGGFRYHRSQRMAKTPPMMSVKTVR